jgi:hypothetical protein
MAGETTIRPDVYEAHQLSIGLNGDDKSMLDGEGHLSRYVKSSTSAVMVSSFNPARIITTCRRRGLLTYNGQFRIALRSFSCILWSILRSISLSLNGANVGTVISQYHIQRIIPSQLLLEAC